MTPRLPARLLGPISLVLVMAACGEDVDFASGRDAALAMTPDAAANGVDGSPEPDALSGNAPDSTAVDAARGPHRFPDAGCPPQGFGTFACGGYGSFCRDPRQCCSGRCVMGYCLPSGTCAAPGSPCTTRSGCCSHRCEPTGRTGQLACTQFCFADGAPCQDASDCCSFGCNGGLCGGPLCSIAGSPCSADAGCCSGHCGPTGCAATTGTCLPTEEACDQDGGTKCCSGFCNRIGRCDLGPGYCREPSTPCNAGNDADCCRGQCARNPQDPRGGSACTAACVADGKDCNSNGDCCGIGSVCTGMPTLCETPSPVCP